MDHTRAPVLEALGSFHDQRSVPFSPPGHKQGRGIDQRVLDVVGADLFRTDVISLNGLDDRPMTEGVLAPAQELMADAVGADHTFCSTSGSSLSVRSAMLAVAAGPEAKGLLLVTPTDYGTGADIAAIARLYHESDRPLDYLRGGLAAGMQIPDPADRELRSVRVGAP